MLPRLSTREKWGGGVRGRERGGIICTADHPQETWGTDQRQGHQEAGLRLDSQGDGGVGGVEEVGAGEQETTSGRGRSSFSREGDGGLVGGGERRSCPLLGEG